MSGFSDEEIDAVRSGKPDFFSPAESALLRMADALADTPSNLSDELYTELRQFFSEEELIEFGASAALENYRARLNRLYNAQSDGLYRRGLRFKQN